MRPANRLLGRAAKVTLSVTPMYRALGFDPEAKLYDATNRSHQVYGANPFVDIFG